MRRCTYCGHENADTASGCAGCGLALPPVEASPGAPPAEREGGGALVKIAVLDSEVQAERVDTVLTSRGIPHLMRTYHDSAYDGLFQTQRGWGHVEAPTGFRQEILEIIADLNREPEPPEAP